MRLHPRRLRRSVLPVCNARGVIGTATAVAPGLALTALHVIATEDLDGLSLGHGYPVAAVESLPLADYRGEQAHRSQQRAERLVGWDVEGALGTVDLALLGVPGLPPGPLLRPRETPVEVDEYLVVPGYPGGHWGVNQGPVTGTDGADFALHMLLGPGASGAPALDAENRVAGIVTLDHESGTVCVGPALITEFLRRLLVLTG